MSELDLELKCKMRELLWLMGLTTRIDVPLRAYVPSASRTAKGTETYTDLDVLGLLVGPDLRLQSTLADCKTSLKGSTERMFWIRGVADFFGVDDAYMVRERAITAAARQLANRLGVSVIMPKDVVILESHHRGELDPSVPHLSFLFDPNAVAKYRTARVSLDKALRELVEYHQFDYWVYDEYRNLQQMVSHLAAAREALDSSHPHHWALLMDCVWQYARSVVVAGEYVRRRQLADADTGLREYLFGGELGLREKQQYAKVLRKFTGRGGRLNDDVLPPYFGQLLEVLTRFLRRPVHLTNVLRYAEWVAEAQTHDPELSLLDAWGATFDPVAAKLLNDLFQFLVTAAGLDPGFAKHGEALLAPLPPGDDSAGLESVGDGSMDVVPTQGKLTE